VTNPLRQRLAHLRWQCAHATREATADARALGVAPAATLALGQVLGGTSQARPPLWSLRPRGFRHPFHYRPGTSDRLVVRQVLGRREYDCVAHETGVRTIFDLGGNIGAASYFLLHAYPDAQVVFVEPDGDNLRVARRNLAPWAGQVAFVQAGVWDASVGLTVDRGGYRDGEAWSIQVRPTRPGETADLRGVTVNDLLRDCGAATIDLVKMDIEAAEAVVFRGDTAWLAATRTLAVELHDADCVAAFDAALTGYDFVRSVADELTVLTGITRRTPPGERRVSARC